MSSLSWLGTFLLILSAFLHASWNALTKSSGNPKLFLLGIFLVNFFFTTLLSPFFISLETGLPLVSFAWAIIAGIFEAGYTVTLGLTFEKSAMGVSYAIMRGGAMLLVWLVSGLFLREAITPWTAVGILFVMLGLSAVHGSKTKKTLIEKKNVLSFLSPDKTQHFFAQHRLAYLCAFFIAGYHLCYGQALKEGAHPVPLLAISLCSSLPLTLLFYGKHSLRDCFKNQFQKKPLLLLTGGVLNALSFLIFLFGLEKVEAGYALTLRNTSVIFAQFLAYRIGEKVTLKQWVGAIWIAIGAALLTWKQTG